MKEWTLRSLNRTETERRTLRDDLATARHEIEFYKNQLENSVRDQNKLLGILDHGLCLRSRKKPRTESTGGDGQYKIIGCVRILRGSLIMYVLPFRCSTRIVMMYFSSI